MARKNKRALSIVARGLKTGAAPEADLAAV